MRLIDADAAKENTVEKWTPVGSKVVSDFLDAQPTIDAVPVVHGQWIEFWDEARGKRHGCSVCAASVAVPDDYCPHCGAKMDAPAVALEGAILFD